VIFELRSYDIAPANLAAYIDAFHTVGYPIIAEYSELLGYWRADTGSMPTVHHAWAYRDQYERHERRTALMQDSRWLQAYLPVALPLIRAQHSQLFRPLPGTPDTLALARTARMRQHPVYRLVRHRLRMDLMSDFRAALADGAHLFDDASGCVGCWQAITGPGTDLLSVWACADTETDQSPLVTRPMDLIDRYTDKRCADLIVPTAFSPLA
jgi:hypothetical protein